MWIGNVVGGLVISVWILGVLGEVHVHPNDEAGAVVAMVEQKLSEMKATLGQELSRAQAGLNAGGGVDKDLQLHNVNSMINALVEAVRNQMTETTGSAQNLDGVKVSLQALKRTASNLRDDIKQITGELTDVSSISHGMRTHQNDIKKELGITHAAMSGKTGMKKVHLVGYMFVMAEFLVLVAYAYLSTRSRGGKFSKMT